jgi:flagellar basal body-associated protein FliL
MKFVRLRVFLLAMAIAFFVDGSSVFAQKPQEISEEDGKPVLLKHLPEGKGDTPEATFTTDKAELKRIVGQPVIDSLEFAAGTEAVTANYPQGKLVIVEYTNPQLSTEVDTIVQQHLAANPQSPFVYRRIGNYNAFVFEPTGAEAANALLDQVKYEKTVQWLGEDPHLLKKLERYMVTTSLDIMISTVLWILLVLGSALLTGVVAGYIFYRFRDQKRATRTAYSDAGGLTRLNLDGLSE